MKTRISHQSLFFLLTLVSLFFSKTTLGQTQKIDTKIIHMSHHNNNFQGYYYNSGLLVNEQPVFIHHYKKRNGKMGFVYLYLHKAKADVNNRIWVIQPVKPELDKWRANAYSRGKFPWSNGWGDPQIVAKNITMPHTIIVNHPNNSYNGEYEIFNQFVNNQPIYKLVPTNSGGRSPIVKYLYLDRERPDKSNRVWGISPNIPNLDQYYSAPRYQTTGEFPWGNPWNEDNIYARAENHFSSSFALYRTIVDYEDEMLACDICMEYFFLPFDEVYNQVENLNGVWLGARPDENIRKLCQKDTLYCGSNNNYLPRFTPTAKYNPISIEEDDSEEGRWEIFEEEETADMRRNIAEILCGVFDISKKRNAESCGHVHEKGCVSVIDGNAACPWYEGGELAFWRCTKYGYKCINNNLELDDNDFCENPTECVCTNCDAEIQDRIQLANNLGFVIDQTEVEDWIEEIQSSNDPKALRIDPRSGTIGVNMALADLPDDDDVLMLAREVSSFTRPNLSDFELAQDAIALSGSTAQARVQLYPGDLDFLDRILISTSEEDEAKRILAEIVKDVALREIDITGYRYKFIEVKFGTTNQGKPVSWTHQEIRRGSKPKNGQTIRWDDPSLGHTFVKIDWIFVRESDGLLMNTSVMFDPIWKNTNSNELESLDSGIDAFFQEIYLHDSPRNLTFLQGIYSKLSDSVFPQYVKNMEQEVYNYSKQSKKNFGKAAKRLYNLTRANCELVDAAYIAELFDESYTKIYQAWSRLKGVLEAKIHLFSNLDLKTMLDIIKTDIQSVTELTEGDKTRLIEYIDQARLNINDIHEVRENINLAKTFCSNLLNEWFEPKIMGNPHLAKYFTTDKDELK